MTEILSFLSNFPRLSMGHAGVLLFALAASLPAAGYGFSSEVVFAAADYSGENVAQLLRIRHAPLAAEVITQQSGTTVGLVVCGGSAYWALNSGTGTRLLRSTPGVPGLEEVGKYTGSTTATAQLASDGQVVYWGVKFDTVASLYRLDSLSPSWTQVAQIPGGRPVALAVENQDAFWAVNTGTAPNGDAILTQAKFTTTGSNSVIHTDGQFTSMAVDQGYVWMGVTAYGSPSIALLIRKRAHAPALVEMPLASGTSGPVVANGGRAVVSYTLPNGSKGLFAASVSSNFPQAFPPQTMPGTDGLALAGPRGVWWSSGTTSVQFVTFKLFDNAYYQPPQSFPAAGFSTPAVRGESMVFAGVPGTTHGTYFRVDPQGQDYQPVAMASGGAVTGVGASRDFFYVATSSTLRAESLAGQQITASLATNSHIVFASGEAQLPRFLFAANSGTTTRTLFSSTGTAPGQIAPGPLGGSSVPFPEELAVWNDQTVFTSRVADKRLLASVALSGTTVGNLWPSLDAPMNLREFQGYLLSEEKTETGDRRTTWINRYGTTGAFGAEFGTPVAQARNVLYFSGTSGLVALTPTAGPQLVPFPAAPATDPETRFGIEWGDSAYFVYKTMAGKKALLSHDPQTDVHRLVLEADDIGEMAINRGRLHITARDGLNENVYQVTQPGTPPQQLPRSSGSSGFKVHDLVSVGDTLYGIADFPGTNVVTISENTGVAPGAGSLNELTSLHRYRGLLLSVTSGTHPELMWLSNTTGAWTPIGTANLSKPTDFLETAGTLYFSAEQNGERRLMRLAPDLPLQVGVVGSSVNPRGLTFHKGRLWFSAQTTGIGRELFAVARPTYLPSPVSSLSSSGYSANPLIDGPRPIELEANEVVQYLPAGALIGEVSAEDPYGVATFSLPPDQPAPVTLDGTSVKLAQQVGTASQIAFSLLATNTLGISNLAAFALPVSTQLDAWLSEHFPGEEGETGDAAADADPDGDKLVNMLERAFATDPNDISDRAGLPVAGQITESGVNRWTISFHTPMAHPADLIYEIQTSSNLQDWSTVGMLTPNSPPSWAGNPNSFESTLDAAKGVYVNRYKSDLPASGKQFLRVRVVRND